MKRFITAIIILSLLAGCASLPDALSFLSPTQTSAPALTPTPFELPATFTPDLFAINTEAPEQAGGTATPLIPNTKFPTATPSPRSTITLEPINVTLFTPSAQLFVSTQRSTSQMVWGYNCDGARSIKFITTIVKPKRLKYVLLFVRLQDKYSARRTDWGAGAIMNDNDRGTYFYTLYVDQIADYEKYEDAWVQFQFVGSTVGLTVLGRSVVSQNEVSLTSCYTINKQN
ncbi:MAG: hypothetical protein MHPDNHAH_01673 [Anaerolineales bacterium]|nr:hypothetical protein [Anaerolineales bacterium]